MKPLAVAVALVAFAACGGTEADPEMERIRSEWATIPADQRHAVCALVRSEGVEVAADVAQQATGEFDEEFHDTLVAVLDDVCD